MSNTLINGNSSSDSEDSYASVGGGDGFVNLLLLLPCDVVLRFGLEKRFGYAVERSAAASL